MAVEPSGGYESGPRLRPFIHSVFPPRRQPGPQEFRIQGERLGDTANGDPSADLCPYGAQQLDPFGFESDLRMMFEIEKVSALQMSVPLRLAAPESGHIDDNLYFRVLRRRRCEFKRSLYV